MALGGLWAAVLWHRLGDVRLAVTLCGLAGLLASPVSWLHHFVWVVPFAVCLADGFRPASRPVDDRIAPPAVLPAGFLALGWVFVGWVAAAPFRRLPNGADVELQWTWSQHLLASVTAILGVARAHRRDRHRPTSPCDPHPASTPAATSVPGLVGEKADHHGRPPE